MMPEKLLSAVPARVRILPFRLMTPTLAVVVVVFAPVSAPMVTSTPSWVMELVALCWP